MSSLKAGIIPEKDPYEVLGVSPTCTDAEIAKAYRQLARKLHPDKQAAKHNLKPYELEKIKVQFHDIQVARSFLLDAEHAADRKKYETKRASDLLRRQTEIAREKGMSERRKRMREDLKQQEKQAASEAAKTQHSYHKYKRKGEDTNNDFLSKEGQKLREQYAGREAAAEYEWGMKKSKESKEKIQDCQIRLKWSRKKMKLSPSEHSLSNLLSSIGMVIAVEMIGSKGNAALVTFADPKSCARAVEKYADSEEMRATFVGKPVNDNEDMPQASRQQYGSENVKDWKIRREMEREQVLRQMEDEEYNVNKGIKVTDNGKTVNTDKMTTNPFPPILPVHDNLSPLEVLEQAEESILKDILTPQAILDMKILK